VAFSPWSLVNWRFGAVLVKQYNESHPGIIQAAMSTDTLLFRAQLGGRVPDKADRKKAIKGKACTRKLALPVEQPCRLMSRSVQVAFHRLSHAQRATSRPLLLTNTTT
jgi:hypothetical protein